MKSRFISLVLMSVFFSSFIFAGEPRESSVHQGLKNIGARVIKIDKQYEVSKRVKVVAGVAFAACFAVAAYQLFLHASYNQSSVSMVLSACSAMLAYNFGALASVSYKEGAKIRA